MVLKKSNTMSIKHGITALCLAVKQEDTAAVKELLQIYGLPKDGPKTTSYSLLQIALAKGFKNIAEMLIQSGCRINHYPKTDCGESVFNLAIEMGDVQVIEMLLQKNVQFSSAAAVISAALTYRVDILKALLKDKRIDVNAMDEMGKCALKVLFERLHLHVKHKDKRILDMIKVLLSCGAWTNFVDSNGQTPLHQAAQLKEYELLQLMLKDYLHVNKCDKLRNTILHILLLEASKSDEAEVFKVVEQWLQKGAQVNITNKDGNTVYHLAAKKKFINVLLILLKFPCNVNLVNHDGNTVMHELLKDSKDYADVAEFAWAIRIMPSIGEIVHTKNKNQKTILHLAMENNHKEIMFDLLDHLTTRANIYDHKNNNILNMHLFNIWKSGGIVTEIDAELIKGMMSKFASVDLKNKNGLAPIHLILKLNKKRNILQALSYVTEVHIQDNQRRTLLHYLADNKLCLNENERKREAKLLLKRGANVNLRDVNDQTPLHIAVANEQEKLVDLFIKFGADVNSRNLSERTPLQILLNIALTRSKHKADLKILNLLLCNGAIVEGRDLSKALYFVEINNVDFLKVILEHLSSVSSRKSNTVLHTLLSLVDGTMDENMILRAVETFIKLGVDVNLANEKGQVALHFAAKNKLNKVSEVLLYNRANATVCDKRGNNVLHYYLSFSRCSDNEKINSSMVKKFLTNGAKVDASNMKGMTPLLIAVVIGHCNIIRTLINHGADVHHTTDKNFNSALHMAAELNHSQVIDILLQHGLNVNAMKKDGTTALHLASAHMDGEIVKTLLTHQADTDLQDDEGKTALHYSCWYKSHCSTIYLLNYSADLHILDKFGKTPMYYIAKTNADPVYENIHKKCYDTLSNSIKNCNVKLTCKRNLSNSSDVEDNRPAKRTCMLNV